MVLGRRSVLLGAGALAACAVAPPAPDRDAGLAAIEARVGGRLGVSVIHTRDGFLVEHRPDERFAMCSTFKAPLAACVLARAQAGALALEERVTFDPAAAAAIDAGPAARARMASGDLSVEELCAATVEAGANSAANLLLDRVGGPAGFTAFLRSIGDETTRLDRTEPSLNENLPGDPRDTTTPAAMRATLGALLLDDRTLAALSRERLTGWMVASTTSLRRLRGGLPADWRAGDKTGTGANGAANDVAIVWPPSRPPILIASYFNAPDATPADRDAVHAEVARIVAEAFA